MKYDILIIGGGINGVGIAREASQRGLKVCLVEKHDLGSGASWASTKLIHGGIRYLEFYEFGLVRESLREREILLHTARHLVKPVEILFPIYRNRKYYYAQIKAGMLLYDLLAGRKSMPRHHALSPHQFFKRVPAAEEKGFNGAFCYFDCQVVYPERLCVENALAARRRGADIRTYTEVTEFLLENHAVKGVRVTDHITGESVELMASVVVNTAGPWVDSVNTLLPVKTKRRIGGTKGSHLVMRQFPGAPAVALYAPARSDGRPFFIIPWRDQVLIGTTDVYTDEPLDEIRASSAEIDYLLAEARSVLPSAEIKKENILFTFAGVRPLPYQPGKNERQVSRRHFIHDHLKHDGVDGLYSIVGGKLTTYRSLAEEFIDGIGNRMDGRLGLSRSASERLPGSMPLATVRNLPEIRRAGMDENQLKDLYSVYGGLLSGVAEVASSRRELAERILTGMPYIGAQVVHSVRQEFARTLNDIMFRRTGMGYEADLGSGLIDGVCNCLQKYCGWTEDRVDREKKQYRDYVARLSPPERSVISSA